MTIIAALQQVNDLLPTATEMIYADLSEANTQVDGESDLNKPVNIILPIEVEDTISGSGTVSQFELNAFFLVKHRRPTIDYKSIEVETECVAPMRQLARQFIHRLNEHSIINPTSAGITRVRYRPVYSELDKGLFGVWVRGFVPVRENLNVCTH